jgi:hypothetical protein
MIAGGRRTDLTLAGTPTVFVPNRSSRTFAYVK